MEERMIYIAVFLLVLQTGFMSGQSYEITPSIEPNDGYHRDFLGNRTIRVPEDAPSIQEGIDRAMNGDTVLVSPGTYQETINMKGKGILLTSGDNGPDSTIIRGEGENPVITLESGEDTTTVIEGFTITGGSQGICIIKSGGMIRRNKIYENYGNFRGGGIGGFQYEDQKQLVVVENEICYNIAAFGGGIYCYPENAWIIGNSIYRNDAFLSGGGIYAYYGFFIITENEIYDNSASSYDGGGIDIIGSSFIIYSNIISNNSVSWLGGGIHVDLASLGNITNNSIEKNTCDSAGGGIHIGGYSENVTIINNQIRYNTGGDGGGLLIGDSCYDTFIFGNIIENNTAVDGGGVQINQNTVLKYNIIRNNQSTGIWGGGGGIYVWDNFIEGRSEISYNLIAGNSAGESSGGGIFCSWGSTPVITNNTIDGNRALNGSGIFIDDSDPDIINNIVVNNDSGYGIERLGGSAYLAYNDVWGNELGEYYNCEPGEGSISEDPLFWGGDPYDYHLQPDSPCIDTGDPALRDPDLSRSDMGCYFYRHSPIMWGQRER
jgi:hypothetical protein